MNEKFQNILVVASKYHDERSNPYLTNDLVHELSCHVKKVTVIGLGEKTIISSDGNVVENIIGIQSKIKFLKYFFIWPKLFISMVMILYKERSIDQLIIFAPLSVLWPAVLVSKLVKVKNKSVIVFDLFPIHQLQIGSIPSYLGPMAKWFESFLLSGFHKITAMGPNNKSYIEKYYSTVSMKSDVTILPLWSRPVKVRSVVDFRTEVTKFVFGGQIIKGREIESMINFLQLMLDRGLKLSLDIYSRGEGFEYLKSKYTNADWIKFCDQVPRDEYFSMLSRYHIGLVVTDRRVTLPTFPSKILDYVNAGLISYCIVESETDLANLPINRPLLYLNHFDFSIDEVDKSIRFFNSVKLFDSIELEESFVSLRKYFSVKSAVLRLLQ